MPKQPVLYEAMYILDSTLDEDTVQGIIRSLEEHITANGGELVASREFGRRRLAYEIEGHTAGTYMITYFRSHGDLVEDLNHEMRLTEGLVRGIVVVANPKAIFDPQAQAAPAEAAPAAEAAAPAEEAAAEEPVAEAPAAEEAPAEEAPAEETPAAEEAPEPAAEEEAAPEAEATPEAEQ